MDQLAGGHGGLDPVKEADELLVAMARPALTDHGAVEDIQRGEQRGRAVPDIIVIVLGSAWSISPKATANAH